MEYKAIEAIPGWYSIAKKAGELYGTIDAYEKVPMYYRAINLRSDALGTVPFQLLRNGEPVDYPFTTPLENLIQQTERSLMLTGRAFWLRLYRGRVLYGFQFLNPRSIEVTYHADQQIGADYLTGLRFTQKMQNGEVHAQWTIADVVYFHEASIKSDINEEVAPARVALQSAQLVYYLERFQSAFFEHGAQPALVLSLDKSVTPPELERMKSHWTRYVENVSNAFKTFFFRGEVKAQIVTFPLDQMDMAPIQENAVKNIVSTFGVPRTMIEASAANYATADSDRQSFWRETIVPRLAYYERILNEQLFKPLKYEFEYLPEMLDVFQVDEAARANSLVLLVQAGLPLQYAMQTLGYQNIEQALGLPEPAIQEVDGGVNVDSNTPVNMTPALPEERNASGLASVRLDELQRYENKATARYKPGKSAAVKFTSDTLPGYLLDYIDTELGSVKKKSEIAEIFAAVKLSYADMTPGEKRVYKAIVKKLETRNDDVAAQIAAGDYTGIDTDLRNVLDKSVADEVLSAGAERVQPIRGMADDQSAQLVEQGIKAHGATYLDKYWNPFLQDLNTTEKSYVDKVIANAMVNTGMTAEDIKTQLSMFGQLRATRIAFTEPTRAASQQTLTIRNQALANGIQVTRIWNTEKDRIVCDMCKELDGLYEDQWASVYSGDQDITQGAPAHVNCRCDTGLEYIGGITQPAETEPVEMTTDEATAEPAEIPLLQRSAAEIAQHIVDSVPADLSADAKSSNDFWVNGGLQKIKDDLSVTGQTYGYASQEYKDALNAALAVQTQFETLRDSVSQREASVYIQVLGDLQHATPQTATVNFIGTKLKPAQQKHIEKFIQLSVGIAPDTGKPIEINVNATGRIGVQEGSMAPLKIVNNKVLRNVMTLNPNATASTIVHESMHALQQTQLYGKRATDDFGDARTAGESPVSLVSQGYNTSGRTYLDHTDSAYTFRDYGGRTYGKWVEVLTTAIDDISGKPYAKDRGLLELFAQIVKDGGQ